MSALLDEVDQEMELRRKACELASQVTLREVLPSQWRSFSFYFFSHFQYFLLYFQSFLLVFQCLTRRIASCCRCLAKWDFFISLVGVEPFYSIFCNVCIITQFCLKKTQGIFKFTRNFVVQLQRACDLHLFLGIYCFYVCIIFYFY